MNEMPDFEMLPPDPPSPKKPRRKPMKRRKKLAITTPKKRASLLQAVKKTRKKRRKVRVSRKVAMVANGHASGRFGKDVYAAMGTLLNMSPKDRDIVIAIVMGAAP